MTKCVKYYMDFVIVKHNPMIMLMIHKANKMEPTIANLKITKDGYGLYIYIVRYNQIN